jgi:Protein of unknown function (DUF2637)
MKLRLARVHDDAGRLLPEFLTNINSGPRFGGTSLRKPGSAMINVATGLLFLLAAGLFVISLSAQYKYVLNVKHASVASWIEAIALDAGMSIFSLLALGLARAGQSARTERTMIVVCAVGSAAMNYAASNAGSPRSVLAYVLPPIFLAVVVDRTISVIRRHYLGETDHRSAWSALGKVMLYILRFALAPPSTATGVRRYVLQVAPLPELPAVQADVAVPEILPAPEPIQATATVIRNPRTGTKTDALIRLVIDRHGPLEALPVSQCSKIATELAEEVDIHPASARSTLIKRVRQAQNGHSDTEVSA